VELIGIITATPNTLLEEVVTLQRMGIINLMRVFVTISYPVGKVLRIQIGIFSVVRKKHIIIMKWKRKIMISQYSNHYKLIYNEH
tara:strand:+ start:606 stop:860 length:255 start_codon:yes stop_codon:yes gene_type:complete